VAAYRADIEIAVRGSKQIQELQTQLKGTVTTVNQLNDRLNSKGLLVNSVNNLSKVASQANTALRSAATGTAAQKRAIDVYVKSLAAAEKAEKDLAAAINKRQRELGLAQTTTTRASSGLGKNIGGSISSAVIGGAFPLLFGQSPEAAVGGAVGGLLGGQAGGFAGSLLGTALGEIAAKQNIIKELAADLGLASDQAETLAVAFKQAGRNSEQFQAAVVKVQGLSLDLKDQITVIQLASKLTGEYGGSIEKVTGIYADFVSKGKVGIADLTKLTAQGIPIQQALADKFGVSRTKVLELAKDGKISVQELSNTLIELGNNVDGQTAKAETGFEKFKKSVEAVATQIVTLARTIAQVLGPALDAVLSKIASGLSGLNQLISSQVTRNLGMAGLALTVGAESQGIDNLRAALSELNSVTPTSQAELDRLNNQLNDIVINLRRVKADGANANKVLNLQAQVFAQQRRLQGVNFGAENQKLEKIQTPSQLPETGGTGPKAPKDRTANLLDDLKAMELISITQDGIRDALFEGNKALAIRLEYDQKVYDINRDTSKALRAANYETEKIAIQAQEALRLKDAELERADKIRQLEREITEEYYSRAGLSTRYLIQREGAGAFDLTLDLDPNNKATQKLDGMKRKLEELTDPINMAERGAIGIGNAFNTAFQGLVSGTQTAQEALAGFFKGVGDAFVSMASEIIAQMVTMFAFKTLLGIFGGGGSSLFSGAGEVAMPGAGVGGGSSMFGAGAPSFFAEGGFVTSPTRAVIGEGNESEYVIPASKMKAAMSRYSRGARGEAVIPTSGSGDTGMAEQSAGPTAIDVRYTVERINSVDYVTADQFQRGMQQAAAQGASQGEQRALRKLQQSPSTRRRVGVS